MYLSISSCVKIDPPMPDENPIISFYYGIDPWTNQPTFIYTDTIISGIKRKYVKANFAASATIKHILVKNNENVIYDKIIENETVYNSEYQIELYPSSLPQNHDLYFLVEDYKGKIAEKTLKVKFQ